MPEKLPEKCECGEDFGCVSQEKGIAYCQRCGRMCEITQTFDKVFWWRPLNCCKPSTTPPQVQADALTLAIEVNNELDGLYGAESAYEKMVELIAMLNTEGCMRVKANNKELRKLVRWVFERVASKRDAMTDEWLLWFDRANGVLAETRWFFSSDGEQMEFLAGRRKGATSD